MKIEVSASGPQGISWHQISTDVFSSIAFAFASKSLYSLQQKACRSQLYPILKGKGLSNVGSGHNPSRPNKSWSPVPQHA